MPSSHTVCKSDHLWVSIGKARSQSEPYQSSEVCVYRSAEAALGKYWEIWGNGVGVREGWVHVLPPARLLCSA